MEFRELARIFNERPQGEPFKPLEVVTSAGEVVTIDHPELAHVTSTNTLYVFRPSDDPHRPQAMDPHRIAGDQITSIRPRPTRSTHEG